MAKRRINQEVLVEGLEAMSKDLKERRKLASDALRTIPDHRQANALESIAALLAVIAVKMTDGDSWSKRCIDDAMKHME